MRRVSAPLPDRAEQQTDRHLGTAPPPVSPSAQVRYLYRAAAYDCGSFVVKGTAVAGKKQNNPYNRCKSTPKGADSYETLLEKMGGTYHQEGDYLIPNLSLPDEPEYRIGKYRRMCRMNSIRSCGKEIVLTELVYVWQMPVISCIADNGHYLYSLGGMNLYLPFQKPLTGSIKSAFFSFAMRFPAAVTESFVIAAMSNRPNTNYIPENSKHSPSSGINTCPSLPCFLRKSRSSARVTVA